MRHLRSKHFFEDCGHIVYCNDSYPYRIFAFVLLVDGKIENWWVGTSELEYQFDLRDLCKIEGFSDNRIATTCWEINTPEEHDRVFDRLSAKWFKQWQVAEGFKGFRPY